MRHRFLAGLAVLPAVIAGVSLAVIANHALFPAITAQSKAVTQSGWSAPRTPWGAPDITGIWGLGYVFTPLERPKELAGKAFLTDEEVAALEKAHMLQHGGDGTGGRARAERGSVADVSGAYNQAFSQAGQHEKVIRTKQTSLVVDPPDGRIPLTVEGRKRLEAALDLGGGDEESERAGQAVTRTLADNPEERLSDRCVGVVLPYVKRAGTFSRIVQGPDSIGIFMEEGLRGTAYRVIRLDGRSHPPSHIHSWLGHSVGRWEGDTLIVETTNFRDGLRDSTRTPAHVGTEKLHMVERFTRTAPDLLMYEITLTDPIVYSRPWTMELPLTLADNKKNPIYEGACHEGNYSLATILAGARLLEKEGAKFKSSGGNKK